MASFSAGDFISGAALVLSAYAIWTTSKFNKRQISLIESQEKLSALQLKQGENDALDAKRADLGANFVKIGSNNYRFKIFNKGKAPAYNVQIEFPDGNEALMQSEIDSKLPLEIMEPHQSVEFIAIITMDTKSKHSFRLLWSDGFSEENEKILYLTI